MPETNSSFESFDDFLANAPPGASFAFAAGTIRIPRFEIPELGLPEVRLWCDWADCDRYMFFKPVRKAVQLSTERATELYLDYLCKHCECNLKRFAVLIDAAKTNSDINAVKVGEWPPFGPPIPSRVNDLVGPDREWLFKGYRSERQGLGIGALAYYRRVVESQRTRILSEVIKVAQRTRADPGVIEVLEKAKSETQFSKSLELARNAIPRVLLIDGHNPLRLLHAATSEGIHALSDEESLDNATAIRRILFDLAQRIGDALKSEDGLRKSLSRLLGPSPPASQ